MDALILAGGETPPELADLAQSTERALIEINGRPMIAYVLEALRATHPSSTGIERIAVAGRQSTLDAATALVSDIVKVPAQEKLVDNVISGMRALTASRVLICTCDIPLVTAATWEELLRGVEAHNLEAAYAIVRRETMEAALPGGRRTYATLKDGTFTGGNAFILPNRALDELKHLVDAAYCARKNPLAMAQLLGLSFIIKALSKRLSVLDIERKMSQILKCRAGAVEMHDAAIAFDVDKADDYHLAQRALQQQIHSI